MVSSQATPSDKSRGTYSCTLELYICNRQVDEEKKSHYCTKWCIPNSFESVQERLQCTGYALARFLVITTVVTAVVYILCKWELI